MATKTILVVDDDPLVIQFLEEVFAYAGYTTIAAQDGTHALDVLAVAHPDIILTDLMMPVLDGVGLCRAVWANPATQAIPLVLMSALSAGRVSIDFPIAGFLQKPFSIDVAVALVESLIGSATTEDRAGVPPAQVQEQPKEQLRERAR